MVKHKNELRKIKKRKTLSEDYQDDDHGQDYQARQGYIMLQREEQNCPPGSSTITSEEECKKAAWILSGGAQGRQPTRPGNYASFSRSQPRGCRSAGFWCTHYCQYFGVYFNSGELIWREKEYHGVSTFMKVTNRLLEFLRGPTTVFNVWRYALLGRQQQQQQQQQQKQQHWWIVALAEEPKAVQLVPR